MGDSLLQIVGRLRSSNTNTISATALLAYDIVITSGQEINSIWRSSWSIVKVVYFATRYYPLLFLLANSLVLTRNNLSEAFCANFHQLQIWGAAVLWPLTDALIVLRIYALYDRNRLVGAFVTTLAIIEIVGVFIMMDKTWQPINTPAIQIPSNILKSTGCVNPIAPRFGFMYAFLGLSVACQTIYVALILAKFRQFVRVFGFSLTPLFTIFFRDGVAYFVVILAVYILEFLIIIFGSVELLEGGLSWLCAMISITACRMVLNIRDITEPLRFDNKTPISGLNQASYASRRSMIVTENEMEMYPMTFSNNPHTNR